jgi:hypothetical protein
MDFIQETGRPRNRSACLCDTKLAKNGVLRGRKAGAEYGRSGNSEQQNEAWRRSPHQCRQAALFPLSVRDNADAKHGLVLDASESLTSYSNDINPSQICHIIVKTFSQRSLGDGRGR